MERRAADRSADHREDRGVPPLHRSRAGRIARHSSAGKPRRDGLGRRRQWRDGRLPPGIHADSGCAGRSHGGSHLWGRTQRQHARVGYADHPQRADHQGAQLQLHARRAARRLHAEHVGRPLLATCAAQPCRLPAAQERQGDFRQYVPRGSCRERGRAREDRLAAEQRRHGICGRGQHRHHYPH